MAKRKGKMKIIKLANDKDRRVRQKLYEVFVRMHPNGDLLKPAFTEKWKMPARTANEARIESSHRLGVEKVIRVRCVGG